MSTQDFKSVPTNPHTNSIVRDRNRKFKVYRFILNEIQISKMESLNLRNYRISSYSIPDSNPKYYPLLQKGCFKYIRRFSLSFHKSSTRKNAKDSLKMVKKQSITNLTILSAGYYSLSAQISSLKYLRSPSNLSELRLKIKDRRQSQRVMTPLSQLLLKSKNVKGVVIEFESCELSVAAMKAFFASLSSKPKLRELVINLSRSPFSDQGIADLTEALMKNSLCLTSLAVCLKGNYLITNKGIVSIGTLIEKLTTLKDLYLDILSTTASRGGPNILLDSIIKKQHKGLGSFHLNPCEIPTIKRFLLDSLESEHGFNKMEFYCINVKAHVQEFEELREIIETLPRLGEYQEINNNLFLSFALVNK